MLRRLYDWVMGLAAHRNATGALAGVSFAESSFFPIPPDIMLIPMALAEPAKAWRYAAIATLFSVLGGIAGYAIGLFFYDTIGAAVVSFYGLSEKFASFADRYNEHGAAIVLFAGMTPFPYKVITIASGVTKLNFAVFIAASVIARGARFFLVCGLLYFFGPPVRTFVERYLGLLTFLFAVLLIGGFVAIKYLV